MMHKKWLYVLQAVILLGCSQYSEQVGSQPNTKTDYSPNKNMLSQTENSNYVTFKVTGTIMEFNIADISKTTRVKNFYTYLTITVEETQPTEVASGLPSDHLKLSWRTDETRDRAIVVGDRVKITLVGNNYTDPTWFKLRDLEKL